MTTRTQRAKEAAWALLTMLVLVVRIVATIVLIFTVIGWIIVAVRSSLNNDFLIPAVVSGAALLLATYIYSYLRARHPRRNGWIA